MHNMLLTRPIGAQGGESIMLHAASGRLAEACLLCRVTE